MSDDVSEKLLNFITRWCPETLGAPLFERELYELLDAETEACANEAGITEDGEDAAYEIRQRKGCRL